MMKWQLCTRTPAALHSNFSFGPFGATEKGEVLVLHCPVTGHDLFQTERTGDTLGEHLGATQCTTQGYGGHIPPPPPPREHW